MINVISGQNYHHHYLFLYKTIFQHVITPLVLSSLACDTCQPHIGNQKLQYDNLQSEK